MDDVTVEEFDRDGMIRETQADAEKVITRNSALRKGALAGSGLVLGAIPLAVALAQSGGLPSGDKKILNYALTLEYLEAAFYEEAQAAGFDGVAGTFASTVHGHEQAHVDALKAVLGSSAVKEPSFDFKGTTKKKTTFLKTAKVLEDTGVAAYLGQAGNIKTPAVLKSAAAILNVEARHAAWVRDILGAGKSPTPAPAAFETGKSMDDILSAVKGTGFIKG